EEVHSHVGGRKPGAEALHPRFARAHSEQRHEIDVGRREPAEEVAAWVSHVVRQVCAGLQETPAFLPDLPLGRLPETAGVMTFAKELPRLAGRPSADEQRVLALRSAHESIESRNSATAVLNACG